MAAPATPLSELTRSGRVRTASPGWIARILAVVARLRQADAERQVALLVGAHDGRMTDDLDRRISRHFV